MATDDKNNNGLLKRWSRNKSLNKESFEKKEDENFPHETHKDSDEEVEKSLSDEELFEKYEIQNPEKISEPSKVRELLDNKIPDRLKQLILRRLWRLVPLYGEISELVEYGEDFTDAATVIDGMQTAYVVGKGYADKIVEKGLKKGKEIVESEIIDKNIDTKNTKDLSVKKQNKTKLKKNNTNKELKENIKKEDKIAIKDNNLINQTYDSDKIINQENTKPSKMIFRKNKQPN